MQVTHHNTLGTQHTGFLNPAGTNGPAGSTDIASSVSALSAALTKSDLVNVGGATGSIGHGTNPGVTPPENNNGAGALLNPDQKPDQNPLLPPHHH